MARYSWICWLVLTASLPQTHGQELGPLLPSLEREVRGARAIAGDRFVTEDALEILVLGVQAPALSADGSVLAFGGLPARDHLQSLISGVALRLEHPHQLADGRLLATVRRADGASIAVAMAAAGHARPLLSGVAPDEAQAIVDAARRAREQKKGIHAKSPADPPEDAGFVRGVTLGLYSQDPAYDYRPLLDQIRSLHASHVLLIVPRFMPTFRASFFRARPTRTAPYSTIARVTRQARARGLSVAYMPILLLETGNDEHWRGTIRPDDPVEWFYNYARLLGDWCDLARHQGVALLCVGSELGSMESDAKRWRDLIRMARARFDGRLTYSANWDHFEKVPFWDLLDFVGMTAYHELTDETDPSQERLNTRWRELRDRLLEQQSALRKPLLFTELGYPSLDGCNTAPWNYQLNTSPDADEQAACIRAALAAFSGVPRARFGGAFYYDWWQNGDATDLTNYSLRGKPAEALLRSAFAEPR